MEQIMFMLHEHLLEVDLKELALCHYFAALLSIVKIKLTLMHKPLSQFGHHLMRRNWDPERAHSRKDDIK